MPSVLTAAKRLPSGLHATPPAESVRPYKPKSLWPSSASHTMVIGPPLARRLPSALQETPLMPIAFKASNSWPLLVFHTFAVPSQDPVARRLLSRLQAMVLMPARCPLRVSSSLPLVASHTLAVVSILPVAKNMPSGLQVTAETFPMCPLTVSSSFPLEASHTFAVWSVKNRWTECHSEHYTVLQGHSEKEIMLSLI